MKKVMVLTLALLMIVSMIPAWAEQEMLEYIVEQVNAFAEELEIIEKCQYDPDADALTLIMYLDIDFDTFNSLDEETKEALYELYMQGDSVLTGSCEIGEVDTTTVSIAKTSDNVPFFLSVNGVNHSWMFE